MSILWLTFYYKFWTPFGLILVLATLLKLEITVLSLAFIDNSFRVTDENLVFETVQLAQNSSFECF